MLKSLLRLSRGDGQRGNRSLLFVFLIILCFLSWGVYSNLATIFVGELHCFGRCLLSLSL